MASDPVKLQDNAYAVICGGTRRVLACHAKHPKVLTLEALHARSDAAATFRIFIDTDLAVDDLAFLVSLSSALEGAGTRYSMNIATGESSTLNTLKKARWVSMSGLFPSAMGGLRVAAGAASEASWPCEISCFDKTIDITTMEKFRTTPMQRVERLEAMVSWAAEAAETGEYDSATLYITLSPMCALAWAHTNAHDAFARVVAGLQHVEVFNCGSSYGRFPNGDVVFDLVFHGAKTMMLRDPAFAGAELFYDRGAGVVAALTDQDVADACHYIQKGNAPVGSFDMIQAEYCVMVALTNLKIIEGSASPRAVARYAAACAMEEDEDEDDVSSEKEVTMYQNEFMSNLVKISGFEPRTCSELYPNVMDVFKIFGNVDNVAKALEKTFGPNSKFDVISKSIATFASLAETCFTATKDPKNNHISRTAPCGAVRDAHRALAEAASAVKGAGTWPGGCCSREVTTVVEHGLALVGGSIYLLSDVLVRVTGYRSPTPVTLGMFELVASAEGKMELQFIGSGSGGEGGDCDSNASARALFVPLGIRVVSDTEAAMQYARDV